MTELTSTPVPPRRGPRTSAARPGQAAKILVAGLSASVTLGLVATMGRAAAENGDDSLTPVLAMTPPASMPLVVVNGQTIRLDQLQQYLDALRAVSLDQMTPQVTPPMTTTEPESTVPASQPSPAAVPTPAAPKDAPAPAGSTVTTTPAPVPVTVQPVPTVVTPAPATVPAPTPAPPVVLDIPVPVPAPVAAPAPAQGNGSSRQS